MADILSQLPGIFYRSPSPDKPAYANVGDTITTGQTIGVVEIMKQFSEVRSEVAGTLASFSIDDAGTVEPGDIIATITEG
ncbi:MAG: biotin carboxyl carrier domain-containing protein [Candidatus Saccharibacteria bacterium]|nr:biotin carboxyl carrier domain-containing protein [Microbacteriaceae bacterium]